LNFEDTGLFLPLSRLTRSFILTSFLKNAADEGAQRFDASLPDCAKINDQCLVFF